MLFVWALRHPASGYVQGINDLVTPLYAVFLEPYASLSSSVVEASEEALLAVEGDVYWCLTRLLDGIQVRVDMSVSIGRLHEYVRPRAGVGVGVVVRCRCARGCACVRVLVCLVCLVWQDHYTPSQPGIQKMVFRLRELVFRVDGKDSRLLVVGTPGPPCHAHAHAHQLPCTPNSELHAPGLRPRLPFAAGSSPGLRVGHSLALVRMSHVTCHMSHAMPWHCIMTPIFASSHVPSLPCCCRPPPCLHTPPTPPPTAITIPHTSTCTRAPEPLGKHLESMDLKFMQFAFRWMNCLLLRELPLEIVLRLWDTCLSEPQGFDDFHVYVCTAMLLRFSKTLRELDSLVRGAPARG